MDLNGPFSRVIGALLRLLRRRRRPAGRRDDGDGEPPVGAGVPVRPKRPAPTLNAAAEADLPPDESDDTG
jgi:hypothetical protein